MVSFSSCRFGFGTYPAALCTLCSPLRLILELDVAWSRSRDPERERIVEVAMVRTRSGEKTVSRSQNRGQGKRTTEKM